MIPSLLTQMRIKNTKKMVAQIEQRMMMDALTGRGRQDVEDLEW